MSGPQDKIETSQMAFSSSVKNTGWHNHQNPNAFERWQFDALSDDGREALVISFHDNFALSPRYFRQEKTNGRSREPGRKCPAVSFTYAVDGKAVFRTVNEFSPDDFSALSDGRGCSIAASLFRIDAVSYGSGFMLEIDLMTTRKRRIKAELEWLSVESDLREEEDTGASACWNIAVPRSDVSGRITDLGRSGKSASTIHFRGTGYHDHVRSNNSLAETVGSRFWGRAHFIDATAVFHCQELGADEGTSAKLFLVQDGAIHDLDVSSRGATFVKNRRWLKLPDSIVFSSVDGIRIVIRPARVIQPGVFEAKFLSEVTLVLPDGKPRTALGLTELIKPSRMQSRFRRWLADMRIGKDGKGPIF